MAITQGIKLDESTQVRLAALAKQKDRSAHWLMKAAIAEYLDREEAYFRELAEDQAQYERHLLLDDSIPHVQVREWMLAKIREYEQQEQDKPKRA